MTDLHVHMDGVPVGVLTQSDRGALSFTYLPEYPEDATPLSLSMPIRARHHRGRVVHAYFSGLLPDRQETLERWGREYGVSPNNPFALLAHTGRDVAGALQILPVGEVPDDGRSGPKDFAVISDAEVGAMVHSLATHPTSWDAGRASGRWSLAGAQAKLALFRTADGAWAIPSGPTPTTHILKPAISGLDDHELNEALSLRAAAACGLPVAHASVEEMPTAGSVFVTQRYDRLFDGRSWVRLHQEDFCQALGVEPSKKYQDDGGPGVGDIARIFDLITQPARSAETSRTMFRALVFNVTIGNTDAHAKNYSILLRDKDIRLAPLYDLASIWAYRSREEPGTRSAMKIGEHTLLSQITGKDWVVVGRRLRIPESESLQIIDEVRSRVAQGYVDALAGMPPSLRERAGNLVDRIVAGIEH
ncbi:type II toxin-antitoxin system HipA family toxin [Nakamurella sp. YIM 132087]|uniref:Type II toxin-antitoxin system HipA family toxin n=1 Tax=Nakamurella alba TaxID=2665158 RepID=A0A7K1FM09_9ACTN|nr:type II toxin-antitoxin system HipA family toxin [Nakamurella alba]MTD15148.1 type II toxin-antitoxin system HipA family toxin [Nakamurella alba]